MTEPLVLSPDEKGYISGPILPDPNGNIGIQFFFNGSNRHKIIIEISLDQVHFSYLETKEIGGNALFHICGLLQGESVRLISHEQCKEAYVLH